MCVNHQLLQCYYAWELLSDNCNMQILVYFAKNKNKNTKNYPINVYTVVCRFMSTCLALVLLQTFNLLT